jgi:hypothetical protein
MNSVTVFAGGQPHLSSQVHFELRRDIVLLLPSFPAYTRARIMDVLCAPPGPRARYVFLIIVEALDFLPNAPPIRTVAVTSLIHRQQADGPRHIPPSYGTHASMAVCRTLRRLPEPSELGLSDRMPACEARERRDSADDESSVGERCRCLQWKSEISVADLVSVQTTVADLLNITNEKSA